MNTATAPGKDLQFGSQSPMTLVRQYGLLVVAIAVAYGRIIVELAKDWWINPDYSHGLLIPFAIGYFLYLNKEELLAIPVRGSWLGAGLIGASQLAYLVGYLGAEYFVQRISLLMLLAGMVWFFLGWEYLKATTFAFVLLLLAIPLPAIIFNSVALPLQLVASSWAEWVLNISGIPVFREGNILTLSQQALNVTEACSGIRSLVTLITLGLMLAYVMTAKTRWKVILVASTVPIALAFNAARVAGTGIMARQFGPEAAEGFFHSFSGWVVFVVAFAVLLAEMAIIQRLTRTKGLA